MKRITFIAQFPPPIHGLSKAVDTLYYSRLRTNFDIQRVNIMRNITLIYSLLVTIISKCDAFYFTISQSKGGLWRDILLMKLMHWKCRPLIIHLHGGYLRTLLDKECWSFQRKLAVRAISKAERCIVLGDSLRWIFQGIVDDDKIVVVPNCVDDEYLLSEVDMLGKTTAVISMEKIHVLYLSNFIATKGYQEVLEVARILKEQGKVRDFCFHFAGKFFDKVEEEYFFKFIGEHELASMIEYHGIVLDDAKRNLLKQCNVFMLLSRYPNEGQPISILEAMGNAMAIVTTDHAGIPDIATVENGFVCNKSKINVPEIVSYLKQCYADRKYLQSVCFANYNQTIKNYTQKAYIDNMESVFESVIIK